MSVYISSGTNVPVATDSTALSANQYQIIKIADGSQYSDAMVSASALYGLQVDVSRIPAINASITGIPSMTAMIYNTPSVAIVSNPSVQATILGIPSVTANIYNTPSVAVVGGLNINASLSGSPSVTLVTPVNVSATQLGIWNNSITFLGIQSVALLAAAEVHAEQLGGWNVSLSGSPSVTIVTPLNISATQLGIWNVSASQIGNYNVSASQIGTWSVALLANPSVTVGMLYGTPSVAPTTHSVTAMIYNTPSVAVVATASVAALKKYVNITNAQAAPIVLWSNVATTRWCITDLIISSQYSTTVTLLDGIASIGRFYFAANGGLATNFSTPFKSGGIGSNVMITTAGTGSVDVTAVGYETA